MAHAEPASGAVGGAGTLNVEVAMSPGPRQVRLVALVLSPGATVRDALNASGFMGAAELGERLEPGGAMPAVVQVGIWGRKAGLDTVLREGDRVECYRALQVDPKEARRVRYRAHGEKLPKGIHRPRGRVPDMTQAPDRSSDAPAD